MQGSSRPPFINIQNDSDAGVIRGFSVVPCRCCKACRCSEEGPRRQRQKQAPSLLITRPQLCLSIKRPCCQGLCQVCRTWTLESSCEVSAGKLNAETRALAELSGIRAVMASLERSNCPVSWRRVLENLERTLTPGKGAQGSLVLTRKLNHSGRGRERANA